MRIFVLRGNRVVAITAIDRVVRLPDRDRIRAPATIDQIVVAIALTTANKRVVAVTQINGISPAACRVSTEFIRYPVITRSGHDAVVAIAAAQAVIANPAVDRVIAATGIDRIIPVTGQNNIRPVRDRITFGIAVAYPHGIAVGRAFHSAGVSDAFNFGKCQRTAAIIGDGASLIIAAAIGDGLHIGIVQDQRICVSP